MGQMLRRLLSGVRRLLVEGGHLVGRDDRRPVRHGAIAQSQPTEMGQMSDSNRPPIRGSCNGVVGLASKSGPWWISIGPPRWLRIPHPSGYRAGNAPGCHALMYVVLVGDMAR